MALDQIVRYWKGKESSNETDVVEFIQILKANMKVVRDLAYEKEKGKNVKQKHYHDQSGKVRSFEVGDYVLVFRPVKQNKLMN